MPSYSTVYLCKNEELQPEADSYERVISSVFISPQNDLKSAHYQHTGKGSREESNPNSHNTIKIRTTK